MAKEKALEVSDDQSASYKQIEGAVAIYKDRCAKVEQLAQAHVDFDNYLTECEKRKAEVNQACSKLKLKLMCGEDVRDEYDKACSEFNEIGFEIGAVKEAMQAIVAVMENRIPIEAEGRYEKLGSEVKSLREKREEVLKEFLTMLAKAVAYKEHIFGRPRSFIRLSAGDKETEPFPLPGIYTFRQRGVLIVNNVLEQDVHLSRELETFYKESVKSARREFGLDGEFEPLDIRIQDTVSAIGEAQGELRSNPKEAVETYLEKERNARAGFPVKIRYYAGPHGATVSRSIWKK